MQLKDTIHFYFIAWVTKYHESGIDVCEAFSCLRLYVRGLLSAGPSEYVIFMYDSLPPLCFYPPPFRLLPNGPSETIEYVHMLVHLRLSLRIYTKGTCTRVYVRVSVCACCKFNGLVRRRSSFFQILLGFPLFENEKEINLRMDLRNCQVRALYANIYFFILHLVFFGPPYRIICNTERGFNVERAGNILIKRYFLYCLRLTNIRRWE